jgi:hypothetical protein
MSESGSSDYQDLIAEMEETELERIMRLRPTRESPDDISDKIITLFLDISSHGGSCISTNCGELPGLRLNELEITKSRTSTRNKKMSDVETITGTFIGTPLTDIVKPKGTRKSVKKKICTWSADICNIPEKYHIYTNKLLKIKVD